MGRRVHRVNITHPEEQPSRLSVWRVSQHVEVRQSDLKFVHHLSVGDDYPIAAKIARYCELILRSSLVGRSIAS